MIICFQLNVYQPWPLARYYGRSSQKVVHRSAPPPSHAPRYSVAALVRASILSLAAFYLSRMGSSRPLDRSRSTSAQLQAVKQGPRQPQCRQGITATPACEHHGTRPLQRRFLLRRCRKGQASQQIYWQLSCRRQFCGASSFLLASYPRRPSSRHAPRGARRVAARWVSLCVKKHFVFARGAGNFVGHYHELMSRN